MSEKKNIDKLFKERLKDFDVAPNDAIWERIENELHKDKRKRRVIPFWWQFAGVAAVLALLFTVGNTVFNTTNRTLIPSEVVETDAPIENAQDKSDVTTIPSETSTDTSEAVATDHTDPKTLEGSPKNSATTSSKDALATSKISEENKRDAVATSEEKTSISKNETSSLTKSNAQQKEAVATVDNRLIKSENNHKNSTRTQSDALANVDKKVESADNNSTKNKSEIDNAIDAIKQSQSTQVTDLDTSQKNAIETAIDSSKLDAHVTEKNAIEEAIAEAEKNKDSLENTEQTLKRWSVAPNVAPVYFNTLGQGSSLDNQFVNNSKEGDVSMSYGVKGSYALNKKLKIRAGVNKVDLGYSTNNVLAFDGSNPVASARQMKNVDLDDSSHNSAFVSANSVSFDNGPEVLFTKEQGSIDQQLGFIEVPVELEYSLVDKKIGLNLIGGFSTLFLNTNEIYSVQNDGNRSLVGEATNINDMSYSANFGIGVNYNISEKFRFNLEPMFKYQIDTFNDTSGDFQPFFIGVYTGLSFKF
ncbi:hypothetical protein [Psychroserpens sp.]|uniref:hypothetical protein n=1 Tax=Psychroserpens sp. TaxID=2020870 RepID=UPI003C76A1F7